MSAGSRHGGRRAERVLGHACAWALLLAVTLASPAAAWVEKVKGSLGVGYAKLFAENSPAGSLSTAAGLSLPVGHGISVGPRIAFDLLGSNTVERGSLIANVDYSDLELSLLAHWTPTGWGPIGLISAGPALVSARAELSTSGGGAAFSDLAVEETVGGAVLDVTLIQTRPSPVRVGLDLGGRWAFLPGDDWMLLSARLCFHY